MILIVSIVSAGVDGYTYNINYNGYSQYNVFGSTQANVYFTKYEFNTYSVHILGLRWFLDKLVVRGRTWQAQVLVPGSNALCVKVGDTLNLGYNQCTGCNQTSIVQLPVPILSYGSHYAIGKHRLIQQGATNTQGNSPSPFYTHSGYNGSFPVSYFTQAAGLTCIFPGNNPPPTFDDDLE